MFCWCHFSHGLRDRSCRGSEARAVRYCLYSALQHSMRAAKRSFLTSSKGRKQWASALGHHLAKPEGCQDREHLFRYGTREKACEKQVLCLGPSLLQLLCASAALECTLLQSMCLLKRRTWYFSILRNSGIDSGSLRGNTARGLKKCRELGLPCSQTVPQCWFHFYIWLTYSHNVSSICTIQQFERNSTIQLDIPASIRYRHKMIAVLMPTRSPWMADSRMLTSQLFYL